MEREATVVQVRFHGRGGQGAKIASRILGPSGFLSGLQVQDFAFVRRGEKGCAGSLVHPSGQRAHRSTRLY